jgi:ankyrin repeat protein
VEAALSCRYSNLSQTNIEKQTPLHLSAQSINPDVLKAVLNGKLIHTWWNQRSEWLNKVDKAGNTALHYAALNLSQGESYRMLLEAGVNPKITDAKGQTPDQLFKASSQQRKLNRSYRDL